MAHKNHTYLVLAVTLLVLVPRAGGSEGSSDESLWLEAEHFEGIRGYCWPMGSPEMKKTAGHWGLSGPGWAAEWNQGGESGFLSIATAADDDKAVVSRGVELPIGSRYFVWVRYADWREKSERFQIRIEQAGRAAWVATFGDRSIVEEDNEMKLYWGWAFAWDRKPVELVQGPARVSLLSSNKEPDPRQIDVVVLTTDQDYRPRIKERPASAAWQLLETYRAGIPLDLEPLARTKPNFERVPAEWRLPTFKDKGFRYLWNMGTPVPKESWLSDRPDRVKVPYNIRDKDVADEFEKMYAGRDQGIPVFSDSRIVPLFHGSGPAIFRTDAAGELTEDGVRFGRWLDQHPDRFWGSMMNYAPDSRIGDKGVAAFQKYRDRYVGSVSGESLGYFYPDPAKMQQVTAAAKTRRQLVESFTPLTLESNTAKYQTVFGRDLDQNPYTDVISCLSVGNIVFAPMQSLWGARTIGYESSAATSSLLPMRWAFMRGIARQGRHTTCTYRSCNFGDSSTIFSNTQSYHTPQNILDNYYSVFSGAGMTWYKFDIWYQYMAGSSMFYHEQGFDEFWKPGGTTAAGVHPTQLSPKGKLVDRFLRVTAANPDRGSPVTPVAFLVDYAHGWEPAPFWPNSFKNWHGHQDRFLFGDHEKMLEEYFWTAYYPIGPESEKPITGTNEVNVAGVFGDIFDCIFAYPDIARWTTIDTYPVVIAAGEIELTDAEGERLARYVDQGGTLLVADAHLTGPGVARLDLPATDTATESDSYRWMNDPAMHSSARFRFKPIRLGKSGRALATTPDGKIFCSSLDRGKGRLIYLSVPHGLAITKSALPVVPRLFAHLTRGLMPIEVQGEVEWVVNRAEQGWVVTLLNPAGQSKPQQGITPSDYRENRAVTVISRLPIRSARDWLLPDDRMEVVDGRLVCEVPAGGVRVIELK